MPPCPSHGAPPPGQDKGNGPSDRPCGDGNGQGKGDGGAQGGFVVVFPLALGATAWATRPRRDPIRLRGRRRPQ
jgi:hypothetical protein